MPDRTSFRQAVLARRPELAGKLRLNKLIHDGKDYTATVLGVGTVYWIAVDEPIETALAAFFAEVDDMLERAN